MAKTNIPYLDEVLQVVTGCDPVSRGCDNCYARRLIKTRLRHRYPQAVTIHPNRLDEPFKWKKPRVVGVGFMGDLFHDDVPDEFIDRVFAVMNLCNTLEENKHTFLLLTKRPDRALKWFYTSNIDYGQPVPVEMISRRDDIAVAGQRIVEARHLPDEFALCNDWPLPNVYLGVSVEDQATADERIPKLLSIPAAHHWVSIEPMLGPVSLIDTMDDKCYLGRFVCHECGDDPGKFECDCCITDTEVGRVEPGLDWVVCGGESGPKARPMHPDWPRKVRDDCIAAGVPFFFKQWGEWADLTRPEESKLGMQHSRSDYIFTATGEMLGAGSNSAPGGLVDPDWEEKGGAWMGLIGKKKAGNVLNGRVWDQTPWGQE